MSFVSQSPFQILSKLSVKVRVLALSLFTIVGLLAVGGVFFWSQNELNTAFSRMAESSRLAEEVAGLSETASALQVIEKQYLGTPSLEGYQSFLATLQRASALLGTIEANPSAGTYQTEIADVRDTLEGTNGAFEMLDALQQRIGYNNSQGFLAVLNGKPAL